VIITRRYFNALAATSAFVSSIAANRANALARIVGERLSKGWGQQVLIENRPSPRVVPPSPLR
jgi:hypothetical protein